MKFKRELITAKLIKANYIGEGGNSKTLQNLLKYHNNNTVMKHIQRLRKIVTLGYHIEWIDCDPFIRWKPTYGKRERPFLTENELSNIETYHLPIARLERVRDLFIFNCYARQY